MDFPKVGARFLKAGKLVAVASFSLGQPIMFERTRQCGRALQVLVVEDCSDTANTMALLLRLAGHTVVLAPDGRTALRLAEEQFPDVVLLDICLPDMSGFQVAEVLTALRGERKLLLIGISGYADL